MNFHAHQQRVQHAEHALQAQLQQSTAQWGGFKQLWHASWTPWRIITVGIAAGFAVGRARPFRLASSGGLLNLLQALAPLLDTQKEAYPPPASTENEQS